MHALNFSIEGTSRSKDVGDAGVHRRSKFTRPLSFRIGVTEHILLYGLVLLNAFQLFRTGLGEFLGHGTATLGYFAGRTQYFGKTATSAPRESVPFSSRSICTRMRLQD